MEDIKLDVINETKPEVDMLESETMQEFRKLDRTEQAYARAYVSLVSLMQSRAYAKPENEKKRADLFYKILEIFAHEMQLELLKTYMTRPPSTDSAWLIDIFSAAAAWVERIHQEAIDIKADIQELCDTNQAEQANEKVLDTVD